MKIPNIRLQNQQLLNPLLLPTERACVLVGSYAGTELFYGKVGSGNAFEVSNDSDRRGSVAKR